MKKIILISGLVLMTLTAPAQNSNYVYNFEEDQPIPEADANGIAFNFNLNGMWGSITNVAITLDITGGFNGDLYAYIVDPDGQMAVLLNRVGMSSTNSFGYSDSGFDITLDDSILTNNIHNYQDDDPLYNINGQLTGTWNADGRTIDPQSQPDSFDSAPVVAGLQSFDGGDPDGNWSFYFADLAAGSEATVAEVGIEVTTAPEQPSWAIIIMGSFLFLAWRNRNFTEN